MVPNYLLNGFKIIELKPTTITVKRTFKERWFSLPWKPLVKTRTECFEMIPDGEVIVDKLNKAVYVNSKTRLKLLAEIRGE